MRCPECSKEKTKVRNLAAAPDTPTVTVALVAINVVVFVVAALAGGGFASGGRGELMDRGQLYGPAVAYGGEWWRIFTSGFLHAGFFHLLMNALFIWILGSQLEPALGRARFLSLYVVSLLAGSLGSLLIQPDAPVVGASGAAFGLLGAAIVMARRRGIDIWSSGLGPILILNLLVTFLVPGIAIGGHLGGVVGGFAAGWVLEEVEERSGRPAALAAAGAMAVTFFGLALVAADRAAAVVAGPYGF